MEWKASDAGAIHAKKSRSGVFSRLLSITAGMSPKQSLCRNLLCSRGAPPGCPTTSPTERGACLFSEGLPPAN